MSDIGWNRRTVGLLLAAAVALAASCIRYRNQTLLLPDGSGRMTVSTSVRVPKQIADDVTRAPRSPAEILASAVDDVEGAAAITDASERIEGEWRTQSYQVWFDDVNRVRLLRGAGSDRRALASFRARREGDGLVLDVIDSAVRKEAERIVKQFDDIDKAPEDQREMLRGLSAMMRATMKDFEVRVEVRMPGEIVSVAGFEKTDARTATLAVTAADLSDAAKARKLAGPGETSVRCGRSVMTEAEISDFRAGLARARAEWAAHPLSREVPTRRTLRIEAEKRVRAAAIARDGGIVAVTSDSAILRWDAKGAAVSSVKAAEADLAIRMDLIDGGTRALFRKFDEGSLACFDCITGKRLWTAEDDRPVKDPATGWRSARWAALALSGGPIVVAREKTSLFVLDGATGRRLRDLPGTWSGIAPVGQGPGGSVIVSGGGRIARADVATGAVLWSHVVPSGFAAASVSASAGVVAYRAEPIDDASAPATGQPGGGTGAPAAPARPAGAPSGSVVRALSSLDGRVLWTVPLSRRGADVIVSPTGRLVLLRGYGDGTLLEGATGRGLGRLRPDVALEPDFVFGADDATLLAWDGMPSDDRSELDVHRIDLPKDLAPAPPSAVAPARK